MLRNMLPPLQFSPSSFTQTSSNDSTSESKNSVQPKQLFPCTSKSVLDQDHKPDSNIWKMIEVNSDSKNQFKEESGDEHFQSDESFGTK